jgi:hypothetical protein
MLIACPRRSGSSRGDGDCSEWVAVGSALAATATIPIVFVIGVDPVQSGFAADRPVPGVPQFSFRSTGMASIFE